jgi:hypothetical protein
VAYKVPKQVEFRDSLPKTHIGKLLRRELAREHILGRGLPSQNQTQAGAERRPPVEVASPAPALVAP